MDTTEEQATAMEVDEGAGSTHETAQLQQKRKQDFDSPENPPKDHRAASAPSAPSEPTVVHQQSRDAVGEEPLTVAMGTSQQSGPTGVDNEAPAKKPAPLLHLAEVLRANPEVAKTITLHRYHTGTKFGIEREFRVEDSDGVKVGCLCISRIRPTGLVDLHNQQCQKEDVVEQGDVLIALDGKAMSSIDDLQTAPELSAQRRDRAHHCEGQCPLRTHGGHGGR